MKTKIVLAPAFALIVGSVFLVSGSATPVYAATTVTVTPTSPNGWFFSDDGNPGGIGNMVTGPGTPPLSTGSIHFALPTASAREMFSTAAFAGTRLDKITALQYSTFRSSVDGGNNLAVTLQFDMDYDLTDGFTGWQSRLVFEPYQTPATVPQNTWQTWTPLTGKWWMASTGSSMPRVGGVAVSIACPQSSPCTWAQVLSAYPNSGLRVGIGLVNLKAGGPWAGFDGNVDALTIGVNSNDTTYDFEPSNTGLVFVPAVSYVGVTGTTQVAININSVANLYGYQFQVNFDQTKTTAGAVFVNTWFNTTGGSAVPPGWNAACNNVSGYCRFASTLLNPAPVVNGSGTVAVITFTGVAPGTVPLTFAGGEILTDRNASPITHVAGTGTLNVFGISTVTGTVSLQGRASPLTSGTVTLTDQSAAFLPTVVNFDASTGAFTATVPSLAGGTTYDVLAAHSLYLGKKYTGLTVTPSGTFSPTPSSTMLLGGDANNSGVIDVSDLSCIGGEFGGPPGAGCVGGSSDINADNTVNILDLVLVGGNYSLTSPQPW